MFIVNTRRKIKKLQAVYKHLPEAARQLRHSGKTLDEFLKAIGSRH